MNANEVIANRAVEILGGRVGDTSLVHPNDDVNRGQSTNDTIHTAINIAAAEELVHGLLPSADSLIQGLRDKKDQFGNIVKSGRTHLQDAVPLRVGQELSGYIGALEQAVKGIKESLDLLYQLGLGGNAVGTGINTPAGYAGTAVEEIARRTGLPFRQAESRFSFMQNTGGALKTSGALKILAVHLDKLAGDLRLLGSGPRTGLAEFRLPPGPAGIFHHAGQSESCHGGNDEYDHGASDRKRCSDHRRRPTCSVGAECDDAGNRPQSAPLHSDHDPWDGSPAPTLY